MPTKEELMDKFIDDINGVYDAVLDKVEVNDDFLPPMAIMIAGDTATGKTHLSCTFPNALLLDTEHKGMTVVKKFNPMPGYKIIKDYETLIEGLSLGLNGDFKTIVLDNARSVYDILVTKTCEELERKTLGSSQVGGLMYAYVNIKISALIELMKANDKHLIFITQLKDEYVGNNKTGRKVYDTFSKEEYLVDYAIELTQGFYKDGWHDKKHVYGKVIKNSFVKIGMGIPVIKEPDYNKIVSTLYEIVDQDEFYNGLLDELYSY